LMAVSVIGSLHCTAVLAGIVLMVPAWPDD
jgi:hypothetical protein